MVKLEPTKIKALTKKEAKTQKIRESRSYERTYDNSPVFSFKNSTLSAGSSEIFDFFQDKPQMQKYGAMTNLVISNNSGVEIKVYLNQDTNREITIPAGTIRLMEKEEIQGGITSLKIKNNDSSNSAAAGTINIETFRKAVEIEDVFRRIHRKFFNIGG